MLKREKNLQKVKHFLWGLAIITMVGLICTIPAAAEEEKPTADFTASALSAYIWRGQEATKNSVVIQPSMTIGYKGFSANVWGNLDTKPYSTTNETYSSTWTETDLTLSYTKTVGIVNAGIGYIYYNLNAPYAGAAKPLDSQELFLTLGINTLLTPTLTVYKEIDHYHQWYFLLGVSHTVKFNDLVSLKLSASASYLLSEDEATYPKVDDSITATSDKFQNFHDGVISASLPITPWKYITVTPTVSWVFPLSDDAKNEMKFRSKNCNDSNFLYGGISMSFTF